MSDKIQVSFRLHVAQDAELSALAAIFGMTKTAVLAKMIAEAYAAEIKACRQEFSAAKRRIESEPVLLPHVAALTRIPITNKDWYHRIIWCRPETVLAMIGVPSIP